MLLQPTLVYRKKLDLRSNPKHLCVPTDLSYFLEVQLGKCVEPVGNLANVEELDLKTGQRTGCAGRAGEPAWTKVNEGMLTPCECEGNPPKGTWDLLQSPPVRGGGNGTGE